MHILPGQKTSQAKIMSLTGKTKANSGKLRLCLLNLKKNVFIHAVVCARNDLSVWCEEVVFSLYFRYGFQQL